MSRIKTEVFPFIFAINDFIIILVRDEIQSNIHFLKQNRNDLRVFLRTDINISFTYRSQLNRMTFYTYIFSFLIIFFVVSHNVEVQFVNSKEFHDTERKDSRFSPSVTDIFW